LKEIEENDIGIYRFPDLGGEDDEDVAAVSMKVWKHSIVIVKILSALHLLFGNDFH